MLKVLFTDGASALDVNALPELLATPTTPKDVNNNLHFSTSTHNPNHEVHI